jgi:hypothetical protein
MNPTTESSTLPGWVRALVAVSAAIVVFRICRLVAGFIFLWMRGVRLLFPIAYFLQDWDYILVTGVSLISAVLVSRWIERKFLEKSRRFTVVTGAALTIIAFLPIEVIITVKPVMASPLEFAIAKDYSMETVEAIIDRYPRLINGSVRPWYHYRPLVEAACGARTNLVELLIRKGANVDEAVKELQQINAEDAVRLVLDCARTHNNVVVVNGSQPIRSETNSAPSATGSHR